MRLTGKLEQGKFLTDRDIEVDVQKVRDAKRREMLEQVANQCLFEDSMTMEPVNMSRHSPI